MKKNNGFGLITALVIIALITVLAVGGTLIYRYNHKKTTDSTTSASTSTNTNTVPANQPAAAPPNHTGTEAVNTVQKAYDTALAYVKSTTNAGQGEIDSIKGYLTAELYNKLTNNVGAGHDQILCSQARPDSLTTAIGANSSTDATVFVNEAFGSTTQKVTTTVDLSTLKISSIACPQ